MVVEKEEEESSCPVYLARARHSNNENQEARGREIGRRGSSSTFALLPLLFPTRCPPFYRMQDSCMQPARPDHHTLLLPAQVPLTCSSSS